MVSEKTRKKILDEYYNEGLPLHEILGKHSSLDRGELQKIILESEEA